MLKTMWAKDLTNGMTVTKQPFLIQDLRLSLTKAGKEYINFKIADKTGSLDGVFWDWSAISPAAQELIQGSSPVNLSGVVSEYNGKLQFKLSGFEPAEHTDQRDFEKASQYDISELWQRFKGFLEKYENHTIKKIASEIVAEYCDEFTTKPAATGMHHAFKSGLIEHTTEMLETGEKLFELPFYSKNLSKDLCFFGLMFHDFGKIFEYGDGPDFKRTVSGIKVPHIPKMAAIIYAKCKELAVAEEVTDELMSIVLSHHRMIAWGSPCAPSSPEALFVHYIDNLHGDVFGVLQRIENDKGSDPYVKHGFGDQAYTVVKKRFKDIIETTEVTHGEGQFDGDTKTEEHEGVVDGF